MSMTVQGQVDDMHLHPDTIKNRTVLIKNILQTDSFSITVLRSGCFYFDSIQYFIKKTNGKYFLSYHGKNDRKKTKRLPQSKLDRLEEILSYGLKIEFGGCTNSNEFFIRSANSQVYFSDDRCNGNDDIFDKVLKNLNIANYP